MYRAHWRYFFWDERFNIHIRRSRYKGASREFIIWMLMHELEHIHRWMRGCKGEHHKGSDGTGAFDTAVWERMKALRKKTRFKALDWDKLEMEFKRKMRNHGR